MGAEEGQGDQEEGEGDGGGDQPGLLEPGELDVEVQGGGLGLNVEAGIDGRMSNRWVPAGRLVNSTLLRGATRTTDCGRVARSTGVDRAG